MGKTVKNEKYVGKPVKKGKIVKMVKTVKISDKLCSNML